MKVMGPERRYQEGRSQKSDSRNSKEATEATVQKVEDERHERGKGIRAGRKCLTCSIFIHSAEIEQSLKRYPYFPLPENMDAIVSHPTPIALSTDRDK